MKKYFIISALTVITLLFFSDVCAGQIKEEKKTGEIHEWWHDRFPDKTVKVPDAKKLLLIEVNLFPLTFIDRS